jgi:hypothetical protein
MPGTYHGVVAPVDIAATFAAVWRAEGRDAARRSPGSTWVRDAHQFVQQ